MPITLNCPGCSHRLKVPDSAAGRRGRCPGCGETVQIPEAVTDPEPEPEPEPEGIPLGPELKRWRGKPADGQASAISIGIKTEDEDEDEDDAPPPARKARWDSPESVPVPVVPLRVVVVDFDMRFTSMVVFIVKWAIAAIPALIILWVLALGVMLAFLMLVTALGGAPLRR